MPDPHVEHGRDSLAAADQPLLVASAIPSVPEAAADPRPYDKEAAALFNNMRLPAAIIGGSILPLGFGFPLKTDQRFGFGVSDQTLAYVDRVHLVVAILSLLSELIAVVYSTVAVNELTEVAVRPTADVMALLQGEYEMAWLGCNVYFLLGATRRARAHDAHTQAHGPPAHPTRARASAAGLLGLAVMIAMRAWLQFGPVFGLVPVLFTLAAVLLMLSIVNEGAAKASAVGARTRSGSRLGSSFLPLSVRYVRLLCRGARASCSPMLLGSVACTLAAVVIGAVRLARLAKATSSDAATVTAATS